VAPEPRALGPGWEWTQASIPLIKVGKVGLNAHPLLLIWICGEVLAAVVADSWAMGLESRVISAGILAWFGVLMIREWSRVQWARMCGSDASETTLWMLGGIEPVGRPWMPNPRLAEAGGLFAGMFMWPILAFIVWRTAGVTALGFNPLQPSNWLAANAPFAWWVAIWAYAINALLLMSNLLLRVFPLDAGRVLEAQLLPFYGRRAYDKALPLAIGYAGGLMILSAPLGFFRVFVLAGVMLLWQIARWHAYRPIRTTPDRTATFAGTLASTRIHEASGGGAPGGIGGELGGGNGGPNAKAGLEKPRPEGSPESGGTPTTKSQSGQPIDTKSKVRTTPLDDAPLSVDEILRKVARSGLGSLTPDERLTLDLETKRLREQ
jgi:hypothetical protein